MNTKFIKWSFISNIAGSAQHVLATHNMFASIELSITLNYIGKDIIGQIGGLCYIHKYGNSIDKDSKKFLYKSHLIQQLGTTLEYLTPFIPVNFLYIAGTANIYKNISFISFGAINALCISKLAVNNIGEIYSKVGALNSIASSIGMSLGLGIIYLLPNEHYFVFPILGAIRIYTFNKAVENLV